MRPYISVGLLSYNEEESIERAARHCSKTLEACGRSYELILVDDGSTDETRSIIGHLLEELPHSRAVYHPRNLGIGAGIRTCYYSGTGQWATWFAADLQADPGELPRLMEHLPHCDVLVTYRDPRQRCEHRMRKWISATDRALVQLLFGVALKDLHWIRFFRREILDRMILRSRTPSVDTEMIVAALRLGARIIEVPLDDHPREAGIAKGARLKTLFRSAGDLLSLRLRPIQFAPQGKVGTLAADCDPTW
jgi:glycosyltransferase involved in cell wall biosynthesis